MFAYNISLAIFVISLGSLAISQTIAKWRFMKLNPDEAGAADKVEFITHAASDSWLWLAGVLVIVSAVSWYTALSRLPLSLMLPVAAIIAPTGAVLAYLFLKEPLSGGQVGAISLIFIGVVWLGFQQ